MRASGASAPEGPLATVATIKSAQRLVAIDRAARQLGLKPGMTLADARARHPALEVAEADGDAEAALLAAVADWCRRFTPLAALDPPDGVILDIAGAAHLFGGEASLLAEIGSRLAQQGFAARAAIADTPEAAWALARFSATRIAPAGAAGADLARLLDALPLAALRLDAATVTGFSEAGLRLIGDIALRPRAPVAARFGPQVFDRYDALMGLARSPISPRFEAPAYLAERRFPEGIVRREDVEGTILSLARELCRLLERYGEGARRLEVTLFRVDGAVRRIAVGTSRPLREPHAMARLFRERIARADDGDDELDAGYGFDVVRLAALAVEPAATPQTTLTEDSHASGDLADLVDRLGARLGIRRVVRLVANDTHIPEFAVTAVAAATRLPPPADVLSPKPDAVGPRVGEGRIRAPKAAAPRVPQGHRLAQGLEAASEAPARPLRLLAHPEAVEAVAAVPDGPPIRFRWRRVVHDVAAVEGPERIAPEWWKAEAAALTRDYFRAEDTHGRRFWLFRDGLFGGETGDPQWFLHGLFG